MGFAETATYALCAFTSTACAVLLLRAWARSRLRLLLWSGWCFVGLAIENAILMLDMVVFPGIDLSVPRHIAALGGVGVLLYGLIWEAR